jgi:hypothetical protein
MNDTNPKELDGVRSLLSNLHHMYDESSSKGDLQRHEIGIFIFGTGQGGQAVLKHLIEGISFGNIQYRVKGFLDNNESKNGTIIEGISVFSPQRERVGVGDFVIIASFMHSYDMEMQLLEIGVEKGKIILPGNWLGEMLSSIQENQSPASDLGAVKPNFEQYKHYVDKLFKSAGSKSDEFVEYDANFHVHLQEDDVKLIAFYLPQFHAIPENDKWWGRGFTEWTNVTKAVPQFIGHHQPQLPIDGGLYDLHNIEVMKRQIELARQYGIGGFCFHHYWFGGKRLLEKPVNNFLAHEEFAMPFCLCWANENWTRRWDGLENEVLIAQNHSPADDLAFIEEAARYFRDKRYIRINDEPLFIVYRPLLFPDIKETVKLWRDYCRRTDIGEIYIAGVNAFAFNNPQEFGFDAVVEFPPNNFFSNDITDQIFTMNSSFGGRIYDYTCCVERSNHFKRDGFITFKGVMPGWDNTARKPNNPAIFYGSNPQIYQRWLESVIQLTKISVSSEHQIVFINAWNEWAEGAHLEPDRKYGYGNLQATANAIINSRINKKK